MARNKTTFSGVANGAWVTVEGKASAILHRAAAGTPIVGTYALQKSYDGGTTVVPVSKNADGDPAIYTDSDGLSLIIEEVRTNVVYRWACTAFTSGNAVGIIG